jgi:hypothetical protein
MVLEEGEEPQIHLVELLVELVVQELVMVE